MSSHIDDLKELRQVNPLAQRNLLIGNGLSIGITKIFAYASLKRVAIIRRRLNQQDEDIFEKLKTSDFELVLRRLKEAAELNRILGHRRPAYLMDATYRKFRRALVDAISSIHPEHRTVKDDWLKASHKELMNFEKVFTTNYDLILYWIIAVDFQNFVDFFWSGVGDNLKFNPFDIGNRNHRTEVYYLHGALFLFSEDGLIQKIRSGLATNLQNLIKYHITLRNHLPLFVSEGTHVDKQNAIANNQYLSFALTQFGSIEEGLTIYGHSLNSESDKHLIEAINQNSKLTNLAISIFTKYADIDDHIAQMDLYTAKFTPFLKRGGTIEFYGYESSPLNYEQYGLPF